MAGTVEEGTIEVKPRRNARQARDRPAQKPRSSDKDKNDKDKNDKDKNAKDKNDKDKDDTKDDDRDEPHTHETEEEPSEDAEVCFVCADHIKYRSIYPCGHTTCHKCALRLRGLMNNRMCTLCRIDRDMVIVSPRSTAERPTYQSFPPEELVYRDTKRGMWFDDRVVKDRVLGLLALRCPSKKCGEVLQSWAELKRHVREKHDRVLCEICTRHKKAFSVEFDLYTRAQLQKHEQHGDSKGFSGHPRCEFCRKRFYSGDELFEHCREKHERCFICERQDANPRGEPRYFENYDKLEHHFRDEHFLCNVQSCLDKKFVVFGSKVEYQHHMLSEHPQLVGKKKEARIVDVDFGPSGNGREGFGSQLSTVPVQPRRAPGARQGGASASSSVAASPALAYDDAAFPALGAAASSSQNNAVRDPRQASVERFHAQQPEADNSPEVLRRRLEERARIYLNYDGKRMDRFIDINSQFAGGNMEPSAVVAEYGRLFSDLSASELEILVHELGTVVRNRAKPLAAAFNSWRERQQFPALGAPRSLPASSTNLAASWVPNRVPPANGGKFNAADFPSLPAAKRAPAGPSASRSYASTSASARPQTTAQNQNSVGPVTQRMATVTLSNARRPSPSPIPGVRPAPVPLSADAFPSLPASNVRRPPPLKPVNNNPAAWGPSSAASSPSAGPSTAPQSESESDTARPRKQKGRKKQVLYSFSTFQ